MISQSSSRYNSDRPKSLNNVTQQDIVGANDQNNETQIQGLDNLKDKILKLSKSDINRRDIFGRTLLHIVASAGSSELLDAVLEHLQLDSTILDFENGWSALHRSILAGNILCSQVLLTHNRELLSLRDRNKDTPFQLLNSITNLNFKPWNADEHAPGTELFTFGSNANHVLGFADSDDRSNPEMVKLRREKAVDARSPREKFNPVRIIDVQISKLHSAVITDDRADNLLICGVPRGGRLGLGNSSMSTQFTFTRIPGLKREHIISVGLGQDHTVAVTAEGDCYTWGSNKHGQLGYLLEQTNEKLEQYSPRKVSGDIKKTRLLGCSASRIHTVVYNREEIYAWGTNIGQLGFNSTPDASVGATVSESSGGGVVERMPRKVFLNVSAAIIDVSATDVATIVLLESHDTLVLINGGYFKVQFPLEPASENFDIFRPRSVNMSGYIVKIASSSNGSVCALSNQGTVYSFSLEKYYAPPSLKNKESVKVNQIAKNLKINTVWTGRTKELCATDVDISDDGSVILSTESGSVWKRIGKGVLKTGSREFRFERVPLINRIQKVKCDSIFGSFAVIREELSMDTVSVRTSSLNADMHYLVPFVDFEDQRKQEVLLRGNVPRAVSSSYIERGYLKHADEYDEEEDSEREKFELLSPLRSWLGTFVSDSLRAVESRYEAGNRLYDLSITFVERPDVEIPVHEFIIRSRSLKLDGLFNKQTPELKLTSQGGGVVYHERKRQLQFTKVEVETVILLIYYFYTDKILDVWEIFPSDVPANIRTAKDEILQFAKILKLDELRTAILRRIPPFATLNSDLLRAMSGNNKATTSDVVIKLKDNQEFYCHSYILRARSSFFAVILSQRWIEQRNVDYGKIVIHLPQITFDVFEIIIAHIYGDRKDDIFDEVNTEFSLKQFLKFVMDVLKAADELSLLKLKEICESVMISFVNVKNAGWILDEAIQYSALQLEERLLYYICHNLDCILENGFISDLDENVFERIDKAMKRYQSSLDTGNVGLDAVYRFVEDIHNHNEVTSLTVPVFGSVSHVTFLSPKDHAEREREKARLRRNSTRRPSSNVRAPLLPAAHDSGDGEVFELDIDDDRPSPSITRAALAERRYSSNVRSSNVDSANFSSPSSRPVFAVSPTMRRGSSSSLNMSENSPKQNTNGWTTVSSNQRNPGSPVASHASFEHSPKQTGNISWNTPNSGQKITSSQIRQSPSLSATPSKTDSSWPGLKKKSTTDNTPSPRAQEITFNWASQSISPANNNAKMISGLSQKLSQKERKKKQREIQESSSPTNAISSSPVSTSNHPWNTPAKDTNIESPFNAYKKATEKVTPLTGKNMAPTSSDKGADGNKKTTNGNSKAANGNTKAANGNTKAANGNTKEANGNKKGKQKVDDTVRPTLADIIRQEERDLEKRNQRATRSLKEIQQEEEFEKWWAEESEKVQQPQSTENDKENRRSDTSKGHNQKGKGNSRNYRNDNRKVTPPVGQL